MQFWNVFEIWKSCVVDAISAILQLSNRRVYHIVTDHAFLGRIHNDVSWNIPKKVYHILTDNFVNLLHISYAWLYKTECWGRKFNAFSFNSHRNCKIFMIILILYSIQFAYPTYSGSPFSDEIAIMIRQYVIHPYLKIRHYVIHPTKLRISQNCTIRC